MPGTESERHTRILRLLLLILQSAILWGCEALQNWLKRQVDNCDKQNDASNKPDEDSNGQEDVPNEQAEASNQLALKFFGHDLGDRCIAPNTAGKRCQLNVKQDNRDWRCNLRKILLSTDATSSLFRPALEAYIISCTCYVRHNTIPEAIQQYMPQWEDELIVYYQQKQDALVADQTMEAAAVERAREDVENLEPFANTVEEQHESDGEDDVHDDSNDPTTESGEQDADAAESPHISRQRGGSSATPPRFAPYRRDEKIWDLMIQRPSPNTEEGYIYILDLPGAHEHVKIGYSKRYNVRLEEWRDCCHLDYNLRYCSDKIPFAMKIESILKIQFEKERAEAYCPGQGKTRHNEFFKLKARDAENAIERWITWMIKLNPYEPEPPHALRVGFVRTLLCPETADDRLLKCWALETWFPRRVLSYDVDDWKMEGSASPMQPQNIVGQFGSGKKKSPRQQRAGGNGTLSSPASRLSVRYGQSSVGNTQHQELFDSSKDHDGEAHETRVTPSSSRNKRPSGPSSSNRGKKSSSTGDDDTPSKPARRPGELAGARKSSSQLSKAASRSHGQDEAPSTTPSRMGSSKSSLTLSRSPPSDDINGILEDEDGSEDNSGSALHDDSDDDSASPVDVPSSISSGSGGRSGSPRLSAIGSSTVGTPSAQATKGKAKTIEPESWRKASRRPAREVDQDEHEENDSNRHYLTLNERDEPCYRTRARTGASPSSCNTTPSHQTIGFKEGDTPASSKSRKTSRSAKPRSDSTTPNAFNSEAEPIVISSDDDGNETMSPVHGKGKGKGKSQSWPNERGKNSRLGTDVIESPSPSFPPRNKKRPGLSGANDPTATKSDSALVKSKKNNRESLTASGHGQRRVASTPAYLHQ